MRSVFCNGQDEQNWQNRAHFFGAAAHAMRQILVDYARSQQRQKRGGWQERVTLADATAIAGNQSKEIVAPRPFARRPALRGVIKKSRIS